MQPCVRIRRTWLIDRLAECKCTPSYDILQLLAMLLANKILNFSFFDLFLLWPIRTAVVRQQISGVCSVSRETGTFTLENVVVVGVCSHVHEMNNRITKIKYSGSRGVLTVWQLHKKEGQFALVHVLDLVGDRFGAGSGCKMSGTEASRVSSPW